MVTGVDRVAVCSLCARQIIHGMLGRFWFRTDHASLGAHDRLASPHPPRPMWVTPGDAPW